MPISGKQAIKILEKKHGFSASRQRGSHVVLVAKKGGKKRVAVVPLHKELRTGTLHAIARQAGIDSQELK